jgi:hypothetical protein
MTSLREAAQAALEALEFYYDQHGEESDAKVITALRAALAEPVQEPVAGNWSVFNTGAEVFSGMSLPEAVAELTPARLERGWSAVCVINKDNPPTYAPPQREPLTKEEIDSIWDSEKVFADIYAIARAVEAAHGIKEGT